jgi:hypothetical protein
MGLAGSRNLVLGTLPRTRLSLGARKYYSATASPAVVGAVIQLGRCFDLLNEAITAILARTHHDLSEAFLVEGKSLPENKGLDRKRRTLDCLVINDCLNRLHQRGLAYDTVRGAFVEGLPVYPGAGFSRETHLQIAVRNPACILGVFRPNLTI